MELQNIDLNRLQIFRSIVLAGNLTKAAQMLRQPKSRISRQLSALEKEVGTQLLFRTTRQLRLTPAGQELLQNALPHLLGLENALEHLTQGAEAVSGRIRITVPDDVGTQLMGGICHSFMALHPRVQIELHVGNAKMDLVRDSFDLALRIGRMKDSSLLQRKIGNLQLAPYIAPGLRAKFGALTTPLDLEEVPYLAFAMEGGMASLRLFKGSEARMVKVKAVFSSNSFFVLRDLAIKESGFALLPSFLASEAVARGQLAPALRDWSLEGSPAHLVLPNQKEIPLRLRKFMEHIRAQMAPFVS